MGRCHEDSFLRCRYAGRFSVPGRRPLRSWRGKTDAGAFKAGAVRRGERNSGDLHHRRARRRRRRVSRLAPALRGRHLGTEEARVAAAGESRGSSSPGHCEFPEDAGQVILEKQTLDSFESPCLAGILDRIGAGRYVVYGVVTEYCVRLAALGLLKTGRRVELVTDAVETLDEEHSRRTLEEFTAAGGVLTTSAEVMAEARTRTSTGMSLA